MNRKIYFFKNLKLYIIVYTTVYNSKIYMNNKNNIHDYCVDCEDPRCWCTPSDVS